MRKKTSVLLDRTHQNAIMNIMKDKGCLESEAHRYLLDRGIQAESIMKTSEITQLKILFYLRQLAGTRGEEFINNIEKDFDDVSEEMIKALHKGYSHVGK